MRLIRCMKPSTSFVARWLIVASVSRHPITVSAGAGAIVSAEVGRPYFGFDERWLKALTATTTDKLSIVRVEGDSMAPTLNAGDDILVDLCDCGERLRDGIYVLRVDDALLIKRLAINPLGRRVTVQSDNPSYPDRPDCELAEINCIWPRHLVRPQDRLIFRPAAVDQPQPRREQRAEPGAHDHAFHRVVDRDANDQPDENAGGEETSSG